MLGRRWRIPSALRTAAGWRSSSGLRSCRSLRCRRDLIPGHISISSAMTAFGSAMGRMRMRLREIRGRPLRNVFPMNSALFGTWAMWTIFWLCGILSIMPKRTGSWWGREEVLRRGVSSPMRSISPTLIPSNTICSLSVSSIRSGCPCRILILTSASREGRRSLITWAASTGRRRWFRSSPSVLLRQREWSET